MDVGNRGQGYVVERAIIEEIEHINLVTRTGRGRKHK